MQIGELEPKAVFHYFEEISNIPRPSYKEKAISDYLVAFAEENKLEYYRDDIYNVIMIKEATPGYEDHPALILQGHMDMVCETAPGCNKDMEKEGPELYLDGDFLRAKGTTLGADDGVAVAFALALLSDESLRHPRLEVIITVSEEVGMDGARALDVTPLKGKLLMNLDSEKEGEVLASCAGGGTARMTYPVTREAAAADESCVVISITGGRGGHSGDEINKGRGNATILLGRVLRHIKKQVDFRLVSVSGGSKDNAIPREAQAIICVKSDRIEDVRKAVDECSKDIAAEFAKTDANLRAGACDCAQPEYAPLTKECSDRYLVLLSSLPNGIRRMSRDIEGLVETSLNLGINHTKEDAIVIGYSVRSSVASAYAALVEKIRFVAEGMGCTVEMHGEYPAWEYVSKSPFRDRLIEIYREMFGKDMEIKAIHAGLECGLLSGKIPGLDAVSMGPDMYDVHTPDEHLSVSSTERMYRFVRKVIENI